MKIRRIQVASVVCLALAVVLELSPGWVVMTSTWVAVRYGIELAAVLVAAGLNVRIIKTMGIPGKARKASQLILLLIILFVVYAFVL